MSCQFGGGESILKIYTELTEGKDTTKGALQVVAKELVDFNGMVAGSLRPGAAPVMNKLLKTVITKLKNRKINLSTAESCTGGMLAQSITSISGASKIFTFGVVTYSNKSKNKYLKVPYQIIRKYGAVSEECCYSMVLNLAKISKAKLNIALTGIAGPSGGSKSKPVGLVYIGIKKNKNIKIYKYLFKNKNRNDIRRVSVKKSLELIKKFI